MRTFPLFIFRTLLLGLALAGSVQALTIQVPGDQPTIQAAVDVAADGDTIVLAAGVYGGEGNRDVSVIQKHLVIVGGEPGGATIDCSGSAGEPHRGFLIQRAEVELINLRIINGYIPEVCATCSGQSGGAIYIRDSSVVALRNCIIDSSYAYSRGGGIRCDSSALTIDSCSFTGNSCWGSRGGALAAIGSKPVLVLATSFTGNRARVAAGVAIENQSEAVFTDCLFSANRSSYGSGTLLIDGSAATSLRRCTFFANSAGSSAAMVATSSTVSVDSCSFIGNLALLAPPPAPPAPADAVTSEDRAGGDVGYQLVESAYTSSGEGLVYPAASGRGGAVSFGDNVTHVRYCVFDGNWADFDGGAIYNFLGQLYIDSCLFSNNHAENQGGAIEGAGTPIAVRHSDFIDNSAVYAGGAILFDGLTSSFDSCRFENNSAANWGGGMLVANGMYTIRGCLFTNNAVQNYRGSGLYFADCSATVENCTLVGNRGGIGATIALDGSNPVLNRCLISYSPTDLSFHRYDSLSMPLISCTDIYGNAGGDWIDFIAEQQYQNGNLNINPLLCDTANGNYAVAYESVCAPTNNSCGQLIGAVEPGCGCCVARGDVNHSGTAGQGEVIVSDLTSLVNYLFKGGEAPPCLIEADVNGSGGGPNASDLTYLVAFLFKGGAAPEGC